MPEFINDTPCIILHIEFFYFVCFITLLFWGIGRQLALMNMIISVIIIAIIMVILSAIFPEST